MERNDAMPRGIPTDTPTYRWVAVVLRVGMYASFTMMVGGLVWWVLAGSPGGDAAGSIAIPVELIVPELLAGNPLALTSLGIVLLLLTPGLTVFTSAITYARARAWPFVGLSAAIALILMVGVALSLGRPW